MRGHALIPEYVASISGRPILLTQEATSAKSPVFSFLFSISCVTLLSPPSRKSRGRLKSSASRWLEAGWWLEPSSYTSLALSSFTISISLDTYGDQGSLPEVGNQLNAEISKLHTSSSLKTYVVLQAVPLFHQIQAGLLPEIPAHRILESPQEAVVLPCPQPALPIQQVSPSQQV